MIKRSAEGAVSLQYALSTVSVFLRIPSGIWAFSWRVCPVYKGVKIVVNYWFTEDTNFKI